MEIAEILLYIFVGFVFGTMFGIILKICIDD